jgi:uncharacterized protein YeeX (DUF496 family)
MTREEMKKAIFRSQDDLVDYIFDYFEPTIEELQQKIDNLQADYDDCIEQTI